MVKIHFLFPSFFFSFLSQMTEVKSEKEKKKEKKKILLWRENQDL